MTDLIEWYCADCSEIFKRSLKFVKENRCLLTCPECGSYKLSQTDEPDPDPQWRVRRAPNSNPPAYPNDEYSLRYLIVDHLKAANQ